MSLGCSGLTNWGHPDMTLRGRIILMSKGRPWEVDLGSTQDVLMMFPRETFKVRLRDGVGSSVGCP